MNPSKSIQLNSRFHLRPKPLPLLSERIRSLIHYAKLLTDASFDFRFLADASGFQLFGSLGPPSSTPRTYRTTGISVINLVLY